MNFLRVWFRAVANNRPPGVLHVGRPAFIVPLMTNTESLASIWDGIWADYISALRSGSATRIAIAKKAVDAFNEAL